jgi:hypothetical protein
MYVSDPLLEAEREKERRRQETYGESPAWIRRVVQAYGRTEEYKWRALLRQAARGSRADIPLGAPISVGDSAKQSGSGLPALAQRSTGISTGSIFTAASAGSVQQTTPDKAVLSTQSTTKETTMDLGNILKDLATTYIRTRYGQPSYPPYMSAAGMGMDQRGYVLASDVYGRDLPSVGMQRPALLQGLLPGVASAGSSVGKIALSIAAAMGLTEITEEVLIAAQAASKVKCRRKRRRLATHSDIKDLAALKAVLGSGKAFDTWIATRKM